MYRHLYLLTALALLLPAALTGCARTEPTMDAEMQRDAAERTGVPGDMISGTMASNSIVENARAVPELSSFVAALEAAGIADELNGPGPYTVFAPINEAFDIADADDMIAEAMDDDTRAALADLLRSHVVDGEVMFDQLNEGEVVQSMTDADHTIAFDNDNMLEKRINDANIVAYDIESSNGVIHVINLVLDEDGFFSQQ